MLKLAFAIFLSLCGVANAQLAGGLQFPGPGTAHSAGGGYVGPLDVAGYTTAYAYWGFRCSSTSYTGNVADIWDSATGNTTETLLTCSSGGTLNETINTLATTCVVACRVKILYDQSGNSRHLDISAFGVSSWPVLTRSGVGLGSVPVMKCVIGFSTTANAAALSQPFTVSQVVRSFSAIASFMDSFSNANNVQIQTNNATNSWLYYAGTVQTFTLNDTLWGASHFVFNGASSTSNVSNSTNNPSGTPSGAVNVGASNFDTTAKVGVCGRIDGGGGLSFDGYIFETIIISGAVSAANQTTAINNQRAYGGGF